MFYLFQMDVTNNRDISSADQSLKESPLISEEKNDENIDKVWQILC